MKTSQIVKLMDLMLSTPFTFKALHEQTRLDKVTIRTIIKELHQNKHIYIAAWEYTNEGRTKLPIYQLGDKEDVPKPKRISFVEATRRYKEKVKQRARFDKYYPFYDMCRPVAFPGKTHRM